MDDNPFLILMNAIAGFSAIFTLFSVPSQYLRRRKRKKNGLLVTPRKVIIKQWLKTSLIFGVILISITAYLVGSYLYSNGVPTPDIALFIITNVIITNILTSLAIGYTVAVIRKDKWSYSSNPELAQEQQD